MKAIYLIILAIIIPILGFCQNFKGKVSFANYYLDNETMKSVLPIIMEDVWISDYFKKVFIYKDDSTKTGGLDWQIFNYKTGNQYTKEFYPNASIVQSKICNPNEETFSHEVLDTTIDFKGLPAKIMIIQKEGKKVAEFYFTDRYRTSPAFYACKDGEMLNYSYEVSKGGFLLQFVQFGELYTWIYQVKNIDAYDVSEEEFKVPTQ